MGSNAALLGAVGYAPYASSKEAIRALTRSAAREWGKFEVAANQTDPTRNSVFFDPALNSKFPYLKTAGAANVKAQILDIANIPQTFQLITIAAERFAGALSGSVSAKEACTSANNEWVKVLKGAGYLK